MHGPWERDRRKHDSLFHPQSLEEEWVSDAKGNSLEERYSADLHGDQTHHR